MVSAVSAATAGADAGTGGAGAAAAWATRCCAYMAISIPGFPNFFLFNGPSSPVGNFSLIDVAERQWKYVEQLLDRVSSSNASGIGSDDDDISLLCSSGQREAEEECVETFHSRDSGSNPKNG